MQILCPAGLSPQSTGTLPLPSHLPLSVCYGKQ